MPRYVEKVRVEITVDGKVQVFEMLGQPLFPGDQRNRVRVEMDWPHLNPADDDLWLSIRPERYLTRSPEMELKISGDVLHIWVPRPVDDPDLPRAA